ncbi:hypothetical protein ACFQO4_10065 [Saliphagus sp. GCM10025334]
MSETEHQLEDVTVGIFLAPAGTEEVEFIDPKHAVNDAGAAVEVLGIGREAGQTVNDDLEAFCAAIVEEFAAGFDES